MCVYIYVYIMYMYMYIMTLYASIYMSQLHGETFKI